MVCSTCAGGNCDSDVPFYDMCNTQLCICLLFFLPLVLFACILLRVCICLGTWLWDSFLHFPQCDLWFFLLMYPWHLCPLTSFEAPIPWGVTSLLLPDVLLVVPSYGCSLVGDLWPPVSTDHN